MWRIASLFEEGETGWRCATPRKTGAHHGAGMAWQHLSMKHGIDEIKISRKSWRNRQYQRRGGVAGGNLESGCRNYPAQRISDIGEK